MPDRVIVLTGLGRPGQIGESVARAFADAGDSLVLLGRSRDELAIHTAALGQGESRRVVAHACDLTDSDQLAPTARQVGEAFGGRVDALVHMAGGFAMSGPVADSDPAVLQTQLAINLTTAVLTTRAFLPLLRPARGAIVYFASASALPGARAAGMSAYLAAKAGVLALMRAVAQEEAPHGIRANALALTTVRTAANTAAMGDDAQYVEREEVAAAVLYLCSPAARPITGQTLQLG